MSQLGGRVDQEKGEVWSACARVQLQGRGAMIYVSSPSESLMIISNYSGLTESFFNNHGIKFLISKEIMSPSMINLLFFDLLKEVNVKSL